MAWVNISVDDDLKARMNAATEEVNWSAVASRAFEIKLGEIAERQKERDTSAEINGLRASKLNLNDEEFEKGYKEGEYWAKNRADYADLERLNDVEVSTEEAAYDLYCQLCPDGETSWIAAQEYWSEILDSPLPELEQGRPIDLNNHASIEGFSRGALDVYNQVADKLD